MEKPKEEVKTQFQLDEESQRKNLPKMAIRQLVSNTKRRARKEKSIGLIVASILLENSKEAWEKAKTVPYGAGRISSGLR